MSSTPFNPNVPQNKDIFSTSQPPFLANFYDIYNAFLVNHVALDAVSNAGNHTIIQMPEQPSTTQFQTDVGEISVYCKDPLNASGVTFQTPQMYLRNQGNQAEFQYTNYQIYPLFTVTNPLPPNQPYFTFLPNNIVVYFGVIQATKDPFVLNFNPVPAKNIIAMNFCTMGTTPGIPAPANLIGQGEGPNYVFTGVSLTTSYSISFPVSYAYYVMVNI